MFDQIYRVDPGTKKLTGIPPITLQEMKLKEKTDLQEWIISNPELLGETLLVITSEYAQFDKSRRRVDILALDTSGSLVVIEVKRDMKKEHADLQALRYAAFCSTMTMEDCVNSLSSFEGISVEEASAKILEFLGEDELPELDDRPRIILVAGSMNDEEVASAVLWLRNFGVDITCVEITPYRDPEAQTLTLVPRTIIPLPEARDYLVSVERKETAKVQRKKTSSQYDYLWGEITERFNGMDVNVMNQSFKTTGRSSTSYLKVHIQSPAHRGVHYEWAVLKSTSTLKVCLHFEEADRDMNLARVAHIQNQESEIASAADYTFYAGKWGIRNIWTTAEFLLDYDPDAEDEVAEEAARVMGVLIEKTYPILREHVLDEES